MSDKIVPAEVQRRRRTDHRQPLLLILCATVASITVVACNFYLNNYSRDNPARIHRVPANVQDILGRCASLKAIPGPTPDFHVRQVSDRYERGTRPTLIKNARIWTGARNGTETVRGDVLLSEGVVKGIGYIPRRLLEDATDLLEIDAAGAWVTPGLVDLHSHVGMLSAPFTGGTFEVNSAHGPILPWLRSIDGFNTHDEALELAIAGGVTSAQVLPGSGNAIGGQAFMIKLRKTAERSPSSMVIEPPHTLNGSTPDPKAPLHWRHMKQACGENLRKYGNRMDAVWALREAYNEARKIVKLQDDFCAKAEAGLWNDLSGMDYPDSFKWEMLVDVLRGRVKIANHCYEEVDLDDIVRLTNEFKFHIASFHHASEAYLVPDLLKKTFGGPPAVALFASHHRYKREAYRGSEHAARILADDDIPVVMKSDHPVINSRYLLYEAQQAHHYGLPPHLALASVTATPARTAGLSHRIGILGEGTDADVVLWDAHPLQLGATPRQVWIDGIPQLGDTGRPVIKPKSGRGWNDIPRVPNWRKERDRAIEYEGLPPLVPDLLHKGKVVLTNVRDVWIRGEEGVKERWFARPGQQSGTVVFINGVISCVGAEGWCFTGQGKNESAWNQDDGEIEIDLEGGSVGPGLMTFGSPLGIEEIAGEPSTGDGPLYDAYKASLPDIMGDVAGVVRAVDALQFRTRNALIAHRAGVTYATSSLSRTSLFTGPQNLIAGLATTFRTGAQHALDHNAIIKPVTALQIHIGHVAPYRPAAAQVSVSTQLAVLRRLLLNGVSEDTETGHWFHKAAEGAIPLLIEVDNADIMASLLQLKADIEDRRGSHMKMVFVGAAEAHLLAAEIAQAKVGVILTELRPFPKTWEGQRILAGPPITDNTTASILFKHGVTVAAGVTEAASVPNTRFDVGWATLEADGGIDKRQRYDMVTTNLEKLMGIEGWIGGDGDLVIYQGGNTFNLTSKVIGIASPRKGYVEFY